MQDFVTLCLDHLEDIALLSYADLPTIDIFHLPIYLRLHLIHQWSHQNSLLIIGKFQDYGGRWEFFQSSDL